MRPLVEQKFRYKVIYGGRSSTKSWSVADALVELGSKSKLRILCAREFQKTIKDSVHKLLKDTIERQGLDSFYYITDNSIIGRNGTEFIFVGLHANIASIKSLEGIDIVWVEEAETVTEESWKILIPTIRKAGSEIWVTFNPREEKDATSVRFILNKDELPNAWVREVNWQENPFFSEESRAEMEYDYRVDADSAAWVWGGKFRKISKAKIFAGKYRVEAFDVDPKDPGWDGPWFGLDWGYAGDPLSAHKYWARGNTLYVEHEVYKLHVELNDIAGVLKAGLPGVERGYTVRADNSRPETISHVRNFKLNITAAAKWPGCVEDGISWLKSLEAIVIHPRCVHAITEAQEYSWKVDKVTGDIKPEPEDKHNHFWDDCRYAMEPAIKTEEREVLVTHTEYQSVTPELDQPDFGIY